MKITFVFRELAYNKPSFTILLPHHCRGLSFKDINSDNGDYCELIKGYKDSVSGQKRTLAILALNVTNENPVRALLQDYQRSKEQAGADLEKYITEKSVDIRNKVAGTYGFQEFVRMMDTTAW